jgi:hypothetical protein
MHGHPSLPARHVRFKKQGLRRILGAALLGVISSSAFAFTDTLSAASPQTVYLQVGVGTFTNPPYIDGGQPANNTTINSVAVTVPSSAAGTGTAQAMTTNSTQTQSYWDNFIYCSVPGQVYIGGFYRTAGGSSAAAVVTATVPAALIDTTGDTIPFSKISWTSSGNLDTGSEPFPAGTFVNGAVQNVGSMASNTWDESCLTFSYVNNTLPPAGSFTGVVLYTLSAP